MTIFLYVLMIFAAGGMLFGNKQYKSKGTAWGRPLAGACGVLALILALVVMVRQIGGTDGRVTQIIINENKYYEAKLTFLANHLSQSHGDKSYMVIINQPNQHNQDRLKILQSTLSGLNVTVWHELEPVPMMGFDAMSPEDELMMEPMMEEMLTSEQFNKILRQYPDVDVVISTVGLPMDYSGMLTWNRTEYQSYQRDFSKKPPSLVLLDAYIYDLKGYINGEQILAVVAHKPDAEYRPDERVPSDTTEAFNKRFLLIHKDNVNELGKTYELFEADQK